jgi:hypothetical protein
MTKLDGTKVYRSVAKLNVLREKFLAARLVADFRHPEGGKNWWDIIVKWLEESE